MINSDKEVFMSSLLKKDNVKDTERYRYYDLIRVISLGLIVLYHMLVYLYSSGVYTFEEVAVYFQNPNMHIATLSVSVFFILSGAGLITSADKSYSVKSFYKKRFIRLMPSFYIVNILLYVYLWIKLKGIGLPDIPRWRFIYSFLGIDGWLAIHKVPTFYKAIGEWFLGAIIILYVLFPVFKFFVDKYPKIFFVVSACVYVITAYSGISFKVPLWENLIIKGCEFILGMYFGRYFKRFPSKCMYVSFPVLVYFIVSKSALNINVALKITMASVAFFVSCSFFEELLKKYKLRILDFLSSVSYEVLLVHHFIILDMGSWLSKWYVNKYMILLMFLYQFIVIIIVAFLVKLLTKYVLKLIKKIAVREKTEK